MNSVIIQISDRVAKVPIPATIFVIVCCVGIFFYFWQSVIHVTNAMIFIFIFMSLIFLTI